jgi:hypothetical protein
MWMFRDVPLGSLKLFAASAAIKHHLTKEGHIMEDFFDDFDEGEFKNNDQFEGNFAEDPERAYRRFTPE